LRAGSPSFTAAVLPAHPVARWLQHATGARGLMCDGVSARLLAALKAGELDRVVGSVDEDSTGDADLAQLRVEPLYDDHVTFVAHPDTPGLDKRRRPGSCS
jgi:DNA-binding transcriptional LysR family regulator